MPHLLRMTLLMKRKEEMSAEEFRRYWAEVHAAKFLSVSLVKDHLVKYQRVCPWLMQAMLLKLLILGIVLRY